MAIVEKAWVVDCGIGVYQEQPPRGIAVGDMVRGIANLGIDPFSYSNSSTPSRACRRSLHVAHRRDLPTDGPVR
jgi:hypothetical protein